MRHDIFTLDLMLGDLGDPIDFTPAMKQCRQYVIGEAKDRFDRQTAPDGIPWAKLKQPRFRPKRWGKRRKGEDKILRDKGPLMASLTVAGAADSIDIITPTSMESGTEIDYGRYHQDGTKEMRGKRAYTGNDPPGMVARPFVGFADDDGDNIAEIITDFAGEEIERRLT